MNKTDTTALAAAIEAFEAEFPNVIWSLSNQVGYVSVLDRKFNILASCYAPTHSQSFAECTVILRQKHGDTSRFSALLDAEYGPELEAVA